MDDKSLPHVNVGTIGHCDHDVIVIDDDISTCPGRDEYIKNLIKESQPYELTLQELPPLEDCVLKQPTLGHGKRGKKGKAKKDWM